MTTELRLRVITGLVLLVVSALILWVSEQGFVVFSGLVLAMAVTEWVYLIPIATWLYRCVYGVIYLIGLGLPMYHSSVDLLNVLLCPLILCLILLRLLRAPHDFAVGFPANVLLAAISCTLSWSCWYAILVLVDVYGIISYLLILFLIGLSDVVAYFSGRRWGRHKLAPTVSPGKSIEGAFIAALVCALLGMWLPLAPNIAAWKRFILVFCCVAVGILSDLVLSALKRRVSLKDSGCLLPGHGGILDRIDSFLLSFPFLTVCLLYGL